MFQTSYSWNDLLFMLQGAGVTLSITFWAVLGGTVLGILFGVLRTATPFWLNVPIAAVLDVFRSVPLLIQFVIANSFKSIIGWNVSAFTVGCVVLALYTSAFCSEIVRSGIFAVPPVTRRAARSLGMSYWQDLREVTFPMALRVALPSWIGLTLGVMKDSALVLWIGIIELLRSAQIVITRTNEPLLILAIAGAIYFIISFPISRLGARLERKWRDHD